MRRILIFMLKNQKIIVTGAASGIGKAIVQQCLQEGASVIACDFDQQALATLQKEIPTEDNLLHTYAVDVSQHEEVAGFFSYIAENHENVTALVNNAGIYLAKNILDYDLANIDKVLAVPNGGRPSS